MMNFRISAQGKALQNVTIVEHYVATTAVCNMPKNKNYGTINRSKIIIEILGLSKSARDNAKIKQLFDKCDEQLGKSLDNRSGRDISMGVAERKKFESQILVFQCQIKNYREEIRGLRQELNGEKWFLDSGRQPRR